MKSIKNENELINKELVFEPIYEEIKSLVVNSRKRVYSVVNIEMLNLYWSIGKIIMEIQKGDE